MTLLNGARQPRLVPANFAEPIAVALVVCLVLINGLLAYFNLEKSAEQFIQVELSANVLLAIEAFESTMTDAEAAQRGYIITGEVSYLLPYQQAVQRVDEEIELIRDLTSPVPEQQDQLELVEPLAQIRLAELAELIKVRRESGFEAALSIIKSVDGEATMEGLHQHLDQMKAIARAVQKTRRQSADGAHQLGVATTVGSILASLTLVAGLLYLVQHNRRHQSTAAARQQATDRELRLFLEQVSDYAIFLITPDLKAATWNQGVKQVLGFTESEFIGADILQAIFTPESIANGSAQAEFTTAAREGEASDDRWMQRKDGKQFWASGITTAAFDSAGRLMGYNKVLRDLTERKLYEERLERIAAELSESDRNKTEFLATLAHELRNPLAPIKNSVQLLSMSEHDKETTELLHIVHRQTDQMVRLIDDLMDVSRISRGRIELRKMRALLAPIVEAAVEACQPQVDSNAQTLEVHPSLHDVVVNVDAARLTQVVSNLINNASKYSDVGSRIEITTELRDDWVFIDVSDNGIGIAPENLDEVFAMFSQVGASVERGASGLGIGLTLVKKIVEKHGGTVQAYSKGVGHGSRFTIALPRADLGTAPEMMTPESVDELPSRSFRILVVDDTRAITMVMSRLLTKLGHEVQTAENGRQASELLSQTDAIIPDFIFSDISMPGMTGYEFVRWLRERPQFTGVRVIAMTGFGQDSDRQKSMGAGFDGHAVKPVDVRVLKQILARQV